LKASGTLGVTGATTLSSTLAVTGITTVAAGTAALPSIVSTTGTADTGQWFPAADTIAWSTAGTERVRIDSSGQVLLGTTSASQSTGSGIKFLDAGGNYSPTAIIIANAADNNTPWMLKNVNATKKNRTIEYLGISIPEFRKHMEKQFYINPKTNEMMNWENVGKWHIDHIIPCASYNLTDIKAQKKCFHYTNLRPLWAEENLKKGAKFII
jgi:hypothetical protein